MTNTLRLYYFCGKTTFQCKGSSPPETMARVLERVYPQQGQIWDQLPLELLSSQQQPSITCSVKSKGPSHGELHNLKERSSAWDGHKRESGTRGNGMCKVRCQYRMVVDQRTAKVTPSCVKLASWRHKCNCGFNDSIFSAKRLDLLKQEKKATRQSARKVTSKGEDKLTSLQIIRRIYSVIGNFA